MIRYTTMNHLPGSSNEVLLLHGNLLKVYMSIILNWKKHEVLQKIIALWKDRYGTKSSLCTMHRFLRRGNFYRMGKQSPLLDIVTFIQHELEGSGSCISYTAMHQRCIRNGLMVSRLIVAQIIKHYDHIGVNTRRRGRCDGREWYFWHRLKKKFLLCLLPRYVKTCLRQTKLFEF